MKPRMNTDAYYKAENPSQSGKDFSNILEARPLWSAQACLRLSRAGATPHEQRRQQAAALQRAQWTIVLLVAASLCVHLCSSVVSSSLFCCTVKIRGQFFSVALCLCGQ